jgi:hypothetical protein
MQEYNCHRMPFISAMMVRDDGTIGTAIKGLVMTLLRRWLESVGGKTSLLTLGMVLFHRKR